MPPPTATTFAVGDDAAVAGPSSAMTPPPKQRRQEPLRPVHITPPQMRMSEVSANLPSQLLASPITMSPWSTHLHDEPLHPASSVDPGNEAQDTFVLNLSAIPPTEQASQLQDTPALLRTPPTQGTPTPAAFSSPTTPQPAATQEQLFWQNWQAQQQHTMQALDTQNRYLTALSAHLPRISRNMSRHTTEMTRLNDNLELFQVENNRILEAIQQQNSILIRHQQNFTQAFAFTQEIMNTNMQAQNSALNDISVIMTHISQQFNQQQGPTSASTSASITTTQTPNTSPQRRSTRQSRGKTPAKPSGRPAK